MVRRRLADDGPPGLGHLRPSAELLRYGFEERGLSSVWALVHPDNAASLRLAARPGFLPVGRGVHYGGEHVVHVMPSEGRAVEGRSTGGRAAVHFSLIACFGACTSP